MIRLVMEGIEEESPEIAKAACRMSLDPAEADGRRFPTKLLLAMPVRGLMMRMVKLHPMSLQYAADGIRAIPSVASSIATRNFSRRLHSWQRGCDEEIVLEARAATDFGGLATCRV